MFEFLASAWFVVAHSRSHFCKDLHSSKLPASNNLNADRIVIERVVSRSGYAPMARVYLLLACSLIALLTFLFPFFTAQASLTSGGSQS
jgi:hypothetical protein